jgi:hypothetical protein
MRTKAGKCGLFRILPRPCVTSDSNVKERLATGSIARFGGILHILCHCQQNQHNRLHLYPCPVSIGLAVRARAGFPATSTEISAKVERRPPARHVGRKFSEEIVRFARQCFVIKRLLQRFPTRLCNKAEGCRFWATLGKLIIIPSTSKRLWPILSFFAVPAGPPAIARRFIAGAAVENNESQGTADIVYSMFPLSVLFAKVAPCLKRSCKDLNQLSISFSRSPTSCHRCSYQRKSED